MYDSGTAGTGLSLTLAPFLSDLNTDPIYFWQQTVEDITVCVRMPEGLTKEEVQFRLTADNISIAVQGFSPLLEGQLYASVDPEASAWIIKNDKRFARVVICELFYLFVFVNCSSQNTAVIQETSHHSLF